MNFELPAETNEEGQDEMVKQEDSDVENVGEEDCSNLEVWIKKVREMSGEEDPKKEELFEEAYFSHYHGDLRFSELPDNKKSRPDDGDNIDF